MVCVPDEERYWVDGHVYEVAQVVYDEVGQQSHVALVAYVEDERQYFVDGLVYEGVPLLYEPDGPPYAIDELDYCADAQRHSVDEERYERGLVVRWAHVRGGRAFVSVTPDLDATGRLFRRMRDAAGLIQPEWAARLGVGRAMISPWEVGAGIPSKPHAVVMLIKMRDDPLVDADDLFLLAQGWGVDPASIGIAKATRAVKPSPEPPAPLGPPPAPPEPPPVDARAVVDGVLLAAAEENRLHVAPLRRTFTALLAALDREGVSVQSAHVALAKSRRDA